MSRIIGKINKFMNDLYEHDNSRSWRGFWVKEDSDTPGQEDLKKDESPAVSMKSWNSYKDINRKKNKTSTTGIDLKTGYEDPLKGYPYNEGKK